MNYPSTDTVFLAESLHELYGTITFFGVNPSTHIYTHIYEQGPQDNCRPISSVREKTDAKKFILVFFLLH